MHFEVALHVRLQSWLRPQTALQVAPAPHDIVNLVESSAVLLQRVFAPQVMLQGELLPQRTSHFVASSLQSKFTVARSPVLLTRQVAPALHDIPVHTELFPEHCMVQDSPVPHWASLHCDGPLQFEEFAPSPRHFVMPGSQMLQTFVSNLQLLFLAMI